MDSMGKGSRDNTESYCYSASRNQKLDLRKPLVICDNAEICYGFHYYRSQEIVQFGKAIETYIFWKSLWEINVSQKSCSLGMMSNPF